MYTVYCYFKSSSRNFLFLACYYLFLSECMTLSFLFFSKFGYDCRSCVYCKVLFHYTVPIWKSTLLVIAIWNNIIILLRSPKSAAYVIFALSFMGTCTLILVSVHKSTLLVIAIWNIIILLRSSKSAAYVIFAISFMGTCTLILVSVHNILTAPLPCLFGEGKLC